MGKQLIWLIALFLLFPLTAEAEMKSIEQLLEDANPGDVIYLENTVYQEDIVIDKSVHIVGNEKTVIKGSGTKDVVSLEADGITIENLTITNSSTNLDHDYAGIKVHSNGNTIMHTKIENSLHGIYLNESGQNHIKDNTIIGNLSINQSRRGNGIHLFYSPNNEIVNNTIQAARDGIYFSFASENHVENNRISETRYGLHYMYSDDNEFYRNEFFNNTGGAAIMYSDFITLKENQFYDHHGLQSFGILLQTANDVLLEKNFIQFNQKGIFMDQSNRNTLINNQITNNRIGLEIWASSKNNTFTENEILENNLPFSTNGGVDANQWSQEGFGNAWSGHAFIDLDEDGKGDALFVYAASFGQVMADQQLGALFLDSPALSIYEQWNQLFSSEEGKIQDDYPLQSKQTTAFPYWIFIIPFAFIIVFRRWYNQAGRG